eukprot:COSAG06_NODE_36961_length_441_cov_0.596491_1_plen_63_part_10
MHFRSQKRPAPYVVEPYQIVDVAVDLLRDLVWSEPARVAYKLLWVAFGVVNYRNAAHQDVLTH